MQLERLSYSCLGMRRGEITIDLEVWDLQHLTTIISQLKAKSVVRKVERVNG